MKKVLISTIHFNVNKNTIACLESLNDLSLDGIDLSVVVIDNASKEAFNGDLKKYKKLNATLITNEKNLGFAGGHNVGMRYGLEHGADYVVILNNDVYTDKHLIEELVKAAETDEKIGMVAPKIYFAKGFEFHKDRYKSQELGKVFWYAGGIMDWKNLIGFHRGVDEVDHGQYDNLEETEFASGCCMLIKRSVLKTIGLFDERYFLYYEDNDICRRIRLNGLKVMYAPKAVLWHKNAGSAGGSGSPLQDYYISRNRMLFGFSYAPFRTRIALIRESFRILSSGRETQKKGIIDFYLRRFGKGSYKV